MTNYSTKTIDEYISAAPAISKPHLSEIREAVESVLPEYEKEIGYGKPYYKYQGWVVGFDVYTNHIGFEVWNGLTDEDRQILEENGYKTGSVTFQIRYDQPVPIDIIRELVRRQVRLNEGKKTGKK